MAGAEWFGGWLIDKGVKWVWRGSQQFFKKAVVREVVHQAENQAAKVSAGAAGKAVTGAVQEADRLLIQGTRHFAGESAIEHFAKHSNSIMNVLEINSYNIVNYLNDANYVIRHGIFVPELNGYVRFIGGPGIKYGFVGINRVTGKITTFHIKKARWLSLNAPSLGIKY